MTGHAAKRSIGKAGRVSPRRELAVVTLAAVASISGVGGLLAAGQHAGTQARPTNGSLSTVSSPIRPKQEHRQIAVAPTSSTGGYREEIDDDGENLVGPADRIGKAPQNVTAARAPARHARYSAVSQGSAPVN